MRPWKPLKPKLIINPLVLAKMDELVRQMDKEIAWHGFVKRLSPEQFYWYDIIMYPQYVTGATVTPDEDDYAKWLMKQMDFNNFEDLRLHGHSHVNMETTPSGVDTKFRMDIMANLKEKDFYIFIITNKSHKINIEIYDLDSKVLYETSDILIEVINENDLKKAETWATKAIKNNIKERSLTPCSITPNHSSFSTPLKPKKKLTLWEAEQLADAAENYLPD